MPEIAPAGQAPAAAAPAAGETTPSTTVEGQGSEPQAGKEGEGTGEPAPKEPEASPSGEADQEPPVRVRKTAKDFIIERQQKKLAKAKDGEVDKDSEGKDPEVDPEDEAAIRSVATKVAAEMVAPIYEGQIEAEDIAEVGQFVADNPDFKPYEARVKAFMKHPSRKDVPIKSLFYEAAGDDLLKIGAKRALAAADEAARSAAGGGSPEGGDGEGKPDWANMGKEEFERRKLQMAHR